MLTKLNYHGPVDPGCSMTVKPNKHAPPGDFLLPEGIVIRTSKAHGVVCWWGTIALHLEAACVASPEFLADVEAAVARAKVPRA